MSEDHRKHFYLPEDYNIADATRALSAAISSLNSLMELATRKGTDLDYQVEILKQETALQELIVALNSPPEKDAPQ